MRRIFSWVHPTRRSADRRGEYTVQDVRRAMSDRDQVEERDRLETLDEMSRCEEIRLEIVQDELDCRQAGASPARRS